MSHITGTTIWSVHKTTMNSKRKTKDKLILFIYLFIYFHQRKLKLYYKERKIYLRVCAAPVAQWISVLDF